MDRPLRIASYNIHKGVSTFNRRLVLHDVQHELHKLSPDLVFLQEVQGEHLRRARRFARWPDEPQHEFLAGEHFYSADVLPEGATFDPAIHGHWSRQVGNQPLVTMFVKG